MSGEAMLAFGLFQPDKSGGLGRVHQFAAGCQQPVEVLQLAYALGIFHGDGNFAAEVQTQRRLRHASEGRDAPVDDGQLAVRLYTAGARHGAWARFELGDERLPAILLACRTGRGSPMPGVAKWPLVYRGGAPAPSARSQARSTVSDSASDWASSRAAVEAIRVLAAARLTAAGEFRLPLPAGCSVSAHCLRSATSAAFAVPPACAFSMRPINCRVVSSMERRRSRSCATFSGIPAVVPPA